MITSLGGGGHTAPSCSSASPPACGLKQQRGLSTSFLADLGTFRVPLLQWGQEVEEGPEKHVLGPFCSLLCPRPPI